MKRIILALTFALGFAQAEWIEDEIVTSFEQHTVKQSYKIGEEVETSFLSKRETVVLYTCNLTDGSQQFVISALDRFATQPKALEFIVDGEPRDLPLVPISEGGTTVDSRVAVKLADELNEVDEIRVRLLFYTGRTTVFIVSPKGIKETEAYKACN